ncbi:MAG TPA: M20/M25/M40 family metallo-hydrolase [Steroidobacteraceae bacterium]|jgi:acetylornithine deacetylase/succinyl-diaminopimelate desuccinylase-like protein
MSPRTSATLAAALAAAGITCAAMAAESAADKASDVLAHEVFKELIEINTTDSAAGNVTTAAEAMAKRFRDAGFPAADVVVLGPENPKKKNVVVRLHGTGKYKPVLLIGHLDVVEAHREDWNLDPFKLTEQDGYFYGRGTSDMKGDDAIMVATLLRMKKEGYKPDRDIILALTADEESGCCNGPDWLIKNHRNLIDAEFVVNTDGYSVRSEKGVATMFRLGATEKMYGDYQLTVTNKGGHSSEPRADNAIYELAQALMNISKYQFPLEINPVTRAYWERLAADATGQRQADLRGMLKTPPDAEAMQRLSQQPADNAVMRTNCVATRLDGGHANNALPQRAQANINCRIFPGHSLEEIRQDLIKVIADPQVTVHYVADNGKVADKTPDRKSVAPPPLKPEVVKPLEAVVAQMWPGIKVVPFMDAGASDAVYTSVAGMPTYGITGLAIDVDDQRAHGRDERIRVSAFYKANEFFYRYMKALTSQ